MRLLQSIIVVFGLLLPSFANAHHIMGIPHYKYGDDYPQLPFAEVKAQVGDYDIHFTYFPGTPKPGQRVRFKLYAYHRETREPFREPLEVSYAKERFLRSNLKVSENLPIAVGQGPEGNDYKFFHTFEDADSFFVNLYFPHEGGIEVIPFPVQIGVTDTRPILGGSIFLLFFSVGTVAVLKRRRKKKA
jgi:hypothetical protein